MRVGDNIAGYDIVAKMKSGGMAALYLGRRSRSGGFEKHVAIKVVHEHLSENKDFTRMFLDEARISASIEHPNVVHVHDLGSTESGRDFMVMEYVPGVALSQVIRAFRRKGRRPTPSIATWVAMQVAAGLHAAHELCGEDGVPLGVVHRDVSPKNVLIAYKGYVKLIDFGIAKATDRIHHTQGPLLKGTFRYMSPEQAHGRSLDRRADIYALGILLWEMLTQRKLFKAANDIALLDLVRNPTIPPPSTYAMDVPPALDAVVMRALAFNPEERPESAAALGAELAAAHPDALGVTQGEVAELIGLAMEGHIPESEDPSVRSAMGAPKPPGPGSAERLTRDLSSSALTASGSAALSVHPAPASVTPTPLGAVSGVRSASLSVTLTAPPSSGPETRTNRMPIALASLLVAALAGVGVALFATGGDGMEAVPLPPVEVVTPTTPELEEQPPDEPGETQEEIAARLDEEARLENERAAAQADLERAAEEERAAEARRERQRGMRRRTRSMRSHMQAEESGPLLVEDF